MLKKKRLASLIIAVVLICTGCNSASNEVDETFEGTSIITESVITASEKTTGSAVSETTSPLTATEAALMTAEEPQTTSMPATVPAKTSELTSLPSTTVTTTETVSQPQENNISLSLNIPNSWESGSDKFFQLDAIVANNGSALISGWTAVIPVASETKIEQSWNCDIKYSDGFITATPVSYNKDISAKGSVNFGMILRNAGEIDSQKAKATPKDTVTPENVPKNENTATPNNNSSVGNSNPKIVTAKDVPAPTTDDWLYVKGNKIVDKDGKEVWLTGTNWFGYNTGTNTFDGLWACDLNTTIAAIANRGFNLLRIPISTELIKEWSNGNYPKANYNQAINSYLNGLNSLEIFDYVIGQCRANGLKIMIDIHSAKTDAMGHMKNMWYEGGIIEKDYLDALAWIAKRYSNDDTIIAYDLKNEPHGKPDETPRAKWDDSKDSDNWKYIAEKAAAAVFSGNPNALVMVEGIEIYPIDIAKNGNFTSKNSADYYYNWWGGNLRGVRDNPINLGSYQNKLVYSPHDYGPAVYEQPWFRGGYTYESLYNDCWYDNWFYIQKEKIAPLLIGEWGGYMSEPNLTWMTYLRKLIKDNKINHTFWCFNANSGDTGGLVLDDFQTWDEAKYEFVKEVLWQKNGKFVGLDHKIPLGKNGVSLGDI